MKCVVQLLTIMSVGMLLLGAIRVAAVTIDDLGFTEENCAALRASGTTIPCECRLNTGNVKAFACYPNCCPKTEKFEGDRCHVENRLTWSVYEQQVCFPAPPREYTDDTPNCFYRGNIPKILSVTAAAGRTDFHFELSLLEEHKCHNLYVAECGSARVYRDDYRINTTDAVPRQCWLNCGPRSISPCTETDCWAHRGETHAVIRTWSMERQLPPGDYALVCYTMVSGDSVGSTLYQTAYAATSFKIS